MTKERLYLFDTTLRDGQQTQGVQFSTSEKYRIAEVLDTLGIDYIEGGWPGANPTDSEFFEKPPKTRAILTAFGMTKRTGRSAENDDVLAAVMNANTPAVCLVGKSHEFHVKTALGITLEENIENLAASFAYVVKEGREAMFDAEHFFDGYKANPAYTLEALHAAYSAGARWTVLCDTNGGTLPHEVGDIVKAVIASGIPGDHIGIHTHNDTENAVANSLAAVLAGARQIQGTLNGLGERCGNANLTTLIPTLLLKEPFASSFTTGVTLDALKGLRKASRLLDDILNRVPAKQAAFVGASAFAHKAGLHASAIAKDPTTYEHIDPTLVGNSRIVPMSNQAGQSNLRERLLQAGLEVEKGDPALSRILDRIKEMESRGYTFEAADASFELLLREEIDGKRAQFFKIEKWETVVDRGDDGSVKSRANVTIIARGQKIESSGIGNGPVNAIDTALRSGLEKFYPELKKLELTDYKVRILEGRLGTGAVTRVLVETSDGKGEWNTIGVHENVIAASAMALEDAVTYGLLRQGKIPE